MIEAYLLLGSNLGNRTKHLALARQEISRAVGRIITQSSIYKTAAWGKTDQPDFYNQVVVVATSLNPHQALKSVQKIEHSFGRNRAEKWGARTLDIDILFWGDSILQAEDLIIPHPEIEKRRFTLIPLAEIAPFLVHPVLNKNIGDMLLVCPDNLPVEKLTNPTDF
jgi:2-amino-4-hydroxy-6-hydroxymethyldihydropteridine diphosphokinase